MPSPAWSQHGGDGGEPGQPARAGEGAERAEPPEGSVVARARHRAPRPRRAADRRDSRRLRRGPASRATVTPTPIPIAWGGETSRGTSSLAAPRRAPCRHRTSPGAAARARRTRRRRPARRPAALTAPAPRPWPRGLQGVGRHAGGRRRSRRTQRPGAGARRRGGSCSRGRRAPRRRRRDPQRAASTASAGHDPPPVGAAQPGAGRRATAGTSASSCPSRAPTAAATPVMIAWSRVPRDEQVRLVGGADGDGAEQDAGARGHLQAAGRHG